MPTIRDVARMCGVSPMTVSFVLNNKPGQVSEETRERVLKAVREMDYRPAASEHKARDRQVLTLGLVAGVEGHSLMQPGYYQAIANGVLTAADQLSHNITFFTNTIFHNEPRKSLRVYCDGRCDGLMVLSPRPGSTLVAALHERGIPFVLIGDTGDEKTISCVDINNVQEGYQVTEYLILRGHRRIAFVGGPEFVRSSSQRHEGYCQALTAHGIPLTPDSILMNNVRPAETGSRIQHMMQVSRMERPTAIFGWNDGAAVQIMQVVQTMGLNVPGDVSIIGIDDDKLASTVNPPLTTVRQPYEAIGRQVLDILVDQIRGKNTVTQRKFLPTELIERDSVAPPSDRA